MMTISGSTRLVEFGRALREGGIPVPPTITRDLVTALEHVGRRQPKTSTGRFGR
jgi:uncharacterized protein with von Willebrand factor type A (vWA) domain